MPEVRTMNFSWHAPMNHADALLVGIAAEQRSHQRWRIHDLVYRIFERENVSVLDISWTYGPVHGGRPDDGRKFIERVLNDALERPLLQDLRDSFPDVIVVSEADNPPQNFLKQFAGG